jgi:hypothetical protein
MLKPSTVLILLALGSAPLRAQQLPRTPFVARGACPFECCRLGAWIARDTLPAYRQSRATGVRLFQLLPGEPLVADSADFYTLALGIIRVRRTFRLADYLADEDMAGADPSTRAMLRRPLAVGDTVYLIGEVTEVGERVWWRGVTATVQMFWSEPGFDDPHAPAVLIRPSRTSGGSTSPLAAAVAGFRRGITVSTAAMSAPSQCAP